MSPSSLVYCMPGVEGRASCPDLVITEEVARVCQGQTQCSTWPHTACHGNHSAIRTTSACVDQRVFMPGLVLSTTTTTTSSTQSSIASTTQNPAEYLTKSKFSLNISKSSQEIEAEPLEPKPAVTDAKSHSEVRQGLRTFNSSPSSFLGWSWSWCATVCSSGCDSLSEPGAGGDTLQAVPDIPATILPIPGQ